jgi:NAD(P)-dependent dehydrogenase (short-subunit alcohol dehydrogenase family)/dienelactone hydrolase
VAQALSDAGLRLALSYRNEAHRELTARWFADKGREQPLFVPLDVTDRAGFAEAAEAVERHFGAVHVLVNNAGVSVFGPTDEASYADYDWIMGVNFGGVVNGLVSFLPNQGGRGPRHVVNIASMAAFLPGPQAGIYTASKFAVRGLTESLRYNLAPHGIGCSLCCPALTRTNAWDLRSSAPTLSPIAALPLLPEPNWSSSGRLSKPAWTRTKSAARCSRAWSKTGADPHASGIPRGFRGNIPGQRERPAQRGSAARPARNRTPAPRGKQGGKGRPDHRSFRSHLTAAGCAAPLRRYPSDRRGFRGEKTMCDQDTEADNESWLALNRRQFTALGAGAAAMTIVPGCMAQTHDGAGGSKTASRAVTITTPDGKADAFFVHPEGGKHPAVILWPDIAGLRDAYKTMGTRLAAAGYAVLVVNQYYRSSPAPILNSLSEWRSPEGQQKLAPMIAAITPAGTVRDAVAFVAWLDGQAEVDTSRKIGTCGYCMGGPFTVRTALANPARVGAASVPWRQPGQRHARQTAACADAGGLPLRDRAER